MGYNQSIGQSMVMHFLDTFSLVCNTYFQISKIIITKIESSNNNLINMYN